MRNRLAALAVLFLAAHLPFLPPTLEDVDSINFAMGVRDFDVARHQPHPPGYPVFIALGRASTAALRAAGVPDAAPRALALCSVLAGAGLVPLLFVLFRGLDPDVRRAWWATGITVASPLFWFTALRPLSDMAGLAAAIAAQALFVFVVAAHADAVRRQRALVAGAVIAALAAGIRSQTVILTAPLMLAALLVPGRATSMRSRALAVVGVAAAALLWAVPLLVDSGGPDGYVTALGSQAGEDFTGVVMLWTTRTPRAAVDAVANSFLWPWGGPARGAVVVALAAAGAVRLVWRAPRVALWLAVAFVPYAAFHLLFHETATIRYALPLVPPVAYLVVEALDAGGRTLLGAGGAAIVAVSLITAAPASRAYGRDGSPTFRLFQDLAGVSVPPGDRLPAADAIGMHAVMRRAEEWTGDLPAASVLRARHGHEWLTLVEQFRQQPASTALFVASPRRTDLVLIDPQARGRLRPYRWTFPELPYVGGARPGAADLYVMRSPGWMLDRGWALTAEVAGVSARDRAGPHLQPTTAWVRGRGDAALLMIGGRNLRPAGEPAARLTVGRDSESLDVFDAPPGFFFRLVPIPAGSLAGDGYVPVYVRAAPVDGSSRPVEVALEQFDLQPEGTLMSGFVDGWHEPEFDPLTARAWRWMSERAMYWVRPVGADVSLTITGESPLTYFEAPPLIRVSVAGRELGRFSPSAGFTLSVVLPAPLLAAASGHVVIESDRWFSPADRGGSADRRHLALRVFSIGVSR